MAAPAFTVRLAVADDLPQVLEIANHWIANSSANFDEHPYTIEYKSSWFAALDPCLVACAVDSNRILGYAYYSSYLPTPSYSHTVETTIYLSPESTGMGVGTVLYQALIETARRRGKHCMLAALTCGNTASERLHHKLGFKKIGMLPESGIKRGVWYGIEYFQLLLQPAADVPPVSLSPALPPIPIKSSPEFRVREANVSHIDSFMHRFGPTFVKQEFCAESELCDFVRQLVETSMFPSSFASPSVPTFNSSVFFLSQTPC
jgi:phosphinothricin acetyltransferase